MSKKLKDDVIIEALAGQIQKACEYQSELSDKREVFYKTYRADPYPSDSTLTGWAKTVHPTAFNAVEWIKPYLFEIFTGDFFSFDGKDDKITEALKEYVRQKLFVEQNGEEKIDDFLHYCLTTHYGIFKVYHKDDYRDRKKTFDSLHEEEFSQLAMLDDIDILSYEKEELITPDGQPFVVYKDVKVSWKETTYKGPWLEVLHPSELYELPGYSNIENNPFVAHVSRRTLDYIKRRETEGVYKKGTHAKAKDMVETRYSTEDTQAELDAVFDSDDLSTPDILSYTLPETLGNNEVLVCECYCKLDIDGDGFTEPVIVTLIDWKAVAKEPEENPYRTPPFVKGMVYREPHKQIGRPIPDLMDPWQRVNTNMLRAVQNAAALSTRRGFMTNDPMAKKALERWSPGTVAHLNNITDLSVKQIDFGAPNQFILKTIEYLNTESQKAGGVNESMMGLDREAMNHTARGMAMKLTASQARQRLYARRLARSFKQVLRKVLDCLRLFPPDDDIVITGMDIVLRKEDLNAQYTVRIDVGTGQQDKEQKAALMDQHLQFLLQAGLQLGLATPEHILRTVRRKYEYLDVDTTGLMITEEEYAREQRAKQQQAIASGGGAGAPGGGGAGNGVMPGAGQPGVQAGGRGMPANMGGGIQPIRPVE